MNLVGILISLLSGAIGGNLAGKLFRNLDLGTVGNSLAGIAGGGLGALILNLLGVGAGDASTNLGTIVGGIFSGGIGGAILMAIVSTIRRTIART